MADATVSSIQSGSESIASGDGTAISISITAVNTARSIVMITESNAATNTRDSLYTFRAELSSSTNILLTRASSSFASAAVVEWTVIEFDSGVLNSLQTGSIDRTNATQNVTISAVDLSKTFVITSLSTSINNSTNEVYAAAELTTTTNLALSSSIAPTSGESYYNYQVVEFASSTNAEVQQVSSTIVGSAGTNVQTITAVDTSKTFIASGGFLTDTSLNPKIRGTATIELTSTTQVTATRTAAGSGINDATYNYWVVELTGSANKVEKIDVSFLTADTSKTDSWTALSTTKTALFDAFSLGNRVNDSATQDPDSGANLFSIALDAGADGATVTRGDPGSPYRVISYAVDWSAGSTGATGTIDRTLEAFTSTASGTVSALDVTGTIDRTLEAFTSTATGSLTVTGTISRTLEDFSITSSGKLTVTGTSDRTLEEFTSSATGKLTATGTIDRALEEFTSTASGTVESDSVTGTIDRTLEAFTSGATGKLTATGTISRSLEDFTVSATGTASVNVTGTLSRTLEDFTSTGTGSIPVTGTIDVTLEAFTVSITGQVSNPQIIRVTQPPTAIPITDTSGKQQREFRAWISSITSKAVIIGTGPPEGLVEADQGATFMNENGTDSNVQYIKAKADISGDRSQGWILI